MEISKGNFGECRFIDCFDQHYGLPSLQAKAFDLCLTDPPYNINAKQVFDHYGNSTRKVTEYNDIIENYELFSKQWFEIIKEKVNKIIFTCGKQNLNMWLNLESKIKLFIWIIPNTPQRGVISKFSGYETILCYNIPRFYFDFDYIIQSVNTGFLHTIDLLHPHPKPLKLFSFFIKDSSSVIDPFLGSGTTAEVCEELGIKWLGYEINLAYKDDIQKRIKIGIQNHSKLKRLSKYV